MPYKLNEEGILINGIIDMDRSEDEMSHEILYLKNFGNSSAAIKNVYLNYSVERGVHPCKIGYWIEKEVVDPDDVEMLEDLVLAAVNDALAKSQEMVASEMSKITGGLNIPGLT